jgi:hypothetical protein
MSQAVALENERSRSPSGLGSTDNLTGEFRLQKKDQLEVSQAEAKPARLEDGKGPHIDRKVSGYYQR